MSRVTRQEKAVAARLRQEFAASRPAFSEVLHDRLRGAIRRQQAGLPSWRGHRVPRWALVAAAACLLIAAAVAWHVIRGVRRPGAASVARAQSAGLGRMTGLADKVVAKTGAAVDVAARGQPWAYLDQDARTVLQMPAARLPFDVVSSLLSVHRQRDSRIPSSRPSPHLERNSLRGQAGARDG
jgi:hypothetical protein